MSVLPAIAPEVLLAESVEGWLARSEIMLLMERAALVPPGSCIVEVGNYRGRSTVALALGALRGAGAPVYSIDPHVEFVGPRGGRFGRADQEHLYTNLARTGVGAQVHVVALSSLAVARSWEGPPVGLLFLDGDHRYEAVRADFEAWRPHLAPGADVLFDDCDFADVARVVDECCASGVLIARHTAGKVQGFELAPT